MSANQRYIASLITVVLAALIGFGSWHFLGRDDEAPTGVAQEAAQQPAAPSAPAAPPPTQAAAPQEPAPETAEAPAALVFDVVRVEPTGDAVIAGRGAPGATVELMRNGAPHDSVVVDATGDFAFVPPALPTGTSDVSLRATLPNGEVVTSRQSVTIVVDESRARPPLVAMAAPGEATVVLSRPDAPAAPAQVAAATAPAASGETAPTGGDAAAQAPAPATQAVEEARAEAPAEPAQPATAPVETADADADRTETAQPETAQAQTPQAPAPAPQAVTAPTPAPAAPAAQAPRATIRIASVEAETGGGLFVTGEGAPLAQVRLYLNDTFVARAQTDTAGAVSFAIGRGVMPGSYKVRLDDVADLTGEVLSRAEVTFMVPAAVAMAPAPAPAAPQPQSPATQAPRAEGAPAQAPQPQQAPGTATAPATPAPAQPQAEASSREPATVTIPEVATAQVSRGDSLWRISRQVYGRGVRYTEIFEANQDQIRDPDLIYPGQIFVLPPDREAAD